MDKIDAIINNLKEIKQKESILTITTQIQVPRQFKMNLYFQHNKDLYVKEHILHKIFLPFYPKSLEITDWEITEGVYFNDHLCFVFQISKEDYIDFIYHRFMEIPTQFETEKDDGRQNQLTSEETNVTPQYQPHKFKRTGFYKK